MGKLLCTAVFFKIIIITSLFKSKLMLDLLLLIIIHRFKNTHKEKIGREDKEDDLKKSKSITKVKCLSKLGSSLYTTCFYLTRSEVDPKCVHKLQSTLNKPWSMLVRHVTAGATLHGAGRL